MSGPPRILLFGASGQLGTSIRSLADMGRCVIDAVPRSVDLTDAADVERAIRDARPEWIINCAAMTDVDGAHVDPQRAYAVNAIGPAHMARTAAAVGARLVQISTEAVFDGNDVLPYGEEDPCRPVSAYGASKRAGESLVAIYSPDSFILRTSWLYSGTTGMNFPTRLLQQLADPDRTISVVTDVVGNPTPTVVLAQAVLALVERPPAAGIYHVCCLGPASKYEWAVEIARSAGYDLDRIGQVTSADYPTVALRPKHVDLSCEKFLATGTMVLPTWQEAWRGLTTEATR